MDRTGPASRTPLFMDLKDEQWPSTNCYRTDKKKI